MAKPTQVELMNAHKIARNNALNAATSPDAVKTSGGVVLTPEASEPPTQVPWIEHPFGGNDNNKRVAQRVASQATAPVTTVEVKSNKQAATDALVDAANFEETNPDYAPSSGVLPVGSREALIAGLVTKPVAPATAPAILPPVTPAASADSAAGTGVVAAGAPAPVVSPVIPPVVPPVAPATAPAAS
jgi:hypothetical protein